jgi:hypothetical protein
MGVIKLFGVILTEVETVNPGKEEEMWGLSQVLQKG